MHVILASYFAYKIHENNPDNMKNILKNFKYILVDEYQITNLIQ